MKKRIVQNKLDKRKHINVGRLLFIGFLIVTLMACFSLNVFAAPVTIWEKADEIMKDVYNKILAISTIAAVVTAAIALLMLNFSKSDKTVTESRAWLKRIIVTWAKVSDYKSIFQKADAWEKQYKNYIENAGVK